MGQFNVTNAGLSPTQDQSILSTNYLQWNDAAGANFADFAQQYLPELYEQEVERFGNRTLSGFLRMVGAEMPIQRLELLLLLLFVILLLLLEH